MPGWRVALIVVGVVVVVIAASAAVFLRSCKSGSNGSQDAAKGQSEIAGNQLHDL
jgi:hypothetical protein